MKKVRWFPLVNQSMEHKDNSNRNVEASTSSDCSDEEVKQRQDPRAVTNALLDG
jgi:hypothetical protein